jgi:hypothetical protein
MIIQSQVNVHLDQLRDPISSTPDVVALDAIISQITPHIRENIVLCKRRCHYPDTISFAQKFLILGENDMAELAKILKEITCDNSDAYQSIVKIFTRTQIK